MKSLVKISLAFIACLLINTTFAQQTAKQTKAADQKAAIKNKVESKAYTFKANYAMPMGGGQRYLTSDYDLRVTKDSVIAYLPYFGRVYMDPPINPDDAGVKFTSTNFTYTSAATKKGWDITIVPKDAKHTSKLRLNIGTNGSASLTVVSDNRQVINFDGDIKTP